jgi:sulfur carrier protein ThiS
MPVIRVYVLSDRLAKLLQCNNASITIESGTYTINDLINSISTQIPGIKVVLDKMKDTVFVAVNGQVKYNFDEKIKVVDDVKISLFEVGAGG